MIDTSNINLDMQKRELEFLKFALDQHAIVSITDIKGNITYVNDKFCEISGFSRKELLGQNHRILKSEEHPDELYVEMWRAIASGNAWHGEIKNRKKDGDYYWVSASIIPFLNEQGKPFQYVSIRTDITKLKEAEEKNASQRHFIELLHRISEMVSEAATIESSLQACLDEICEYAGWPVGHAYLYQPDDEYVLKSSLVFHLSDPAAFEVFKEVTVKTKFRSGEGLPGRVSQSSKPAWIIDVTKDPNFPRAKLAKNIGVKAGFAFPVKIEGRTFAVLEFFAKEAVEPDKTTLDIVANICRQLGSVIARKKAEEKITQQKAVLETTLETMDQGITMIDGELNVISVNSKFKELLEFPEEIFSEITSLEIFFRYNANRGEYGDGDIEEQVQQRMDLSRKFEAHHFERTRPDGIIIEVHGNPLPDNQGMVTTYTDITERKKAEEKIAAKEAQLRMAMEYMPGAMIVVDSDLRVTAVNDTYKEFFGDPDELISPGASMREILNSEISRGLLSGKGKPEEILKERIESFHPDSLVTYEDRSPDGRYFHLSRTLTPDHHTVTVAVDVTARKLAEKELRGAYEIISSSIDYASRIQRSILPDEGILSSVLQDHFILWEPRDVVGGDIYWHGAWGNGCLIMLGDCTGHGVPGAFMTLITIGALERAMSEVEGGNVGSLILGVHQYIQTALGQHYEGGDSDDGIELGACYFVPEEPQITFVGARFDLFIIDGGKISTVKGTKKGMGYRGISYTQEYEENKVDLRPGQSFYMTTDGLLDQVGGERNRMLGKKRFKELLLSIQDEPMSEQKGAIFQALLDYQGDGNRRDDVSVIGFII